MDPNVTLEILRNRAREILKATDGQGVLEVGAIVELAEAVEALDHWLKAGGFLPKDWCRRG